MKKLTQSIEDYLETIFVLSKDGSVKSVDVANTLGVSKPAVNKATKELLESGLIEKLSYGSITLTSEGMDAARGIFEKHTLIKQLLLKLGVPSDIADIDCCKIEHVLSPETLQCISDFLKK